MLIYIPFEKWGRSSFAENKFASYTHKFKYALCKVWLKFGPWFFILFQGMKNNYIFSIRTFTYVHNW